MEEEIIEVSLTDAIGACLLELNNEKPGTEEYDAIVMQLDRLYKLQNDEAKLLNSYKIEMDKMSTDNKLKKQELALREAELEHSKYQLEVDSSLREKEIRAEHVKTGATVLTTGASIGATIWLALKTMKFEESGSIRSKAWPKIHLFR